MPEKVNIGKDASLYPMPVTLVGANVQGRANFMAVAWVTRVNSKPAILAVALNNIHYTPEGIRENQTFSINIPSTGMLETTDYCGLVSGRRADKSQLFDVFYGETKTAPMIQQCPLCFECKLLHIHELPTNTLYLGEVVAAFSEEKYMTDGKPDIKKMDPFVLSMPDNKYWTVGDYIGKAWGAGKKLKEKPI
jgi:flavin reductase (DIM6/NTAB) family NADH-FMN oxidoreductase RutF